MSESFEGEVQLGGEDGPVVGVAIGDIDDAGWLGQVRNAPRVLESFGYGAVTVELREGERAGWTAHGYLDAAGGLRGQTAFEPIGR